VGFDSKISKGEKQRTKGGVAGQPRETAQSRDPGNADGPGLNCSSVMRRGSPTLDPPPENARKFGLTMEGVRRGPQKVFMGVGGRIVV